MKDVGVFHPANIRTRTKGKDRHHDTRGSFFAFIMYRSVVAAFGN